MLKLTEEERRNRVGSVVSLFLDQNKEKQKK